MLYINQRTRRTRVPPPSQRLKQRPQRVRRATASSSRPRPRHRHQPERRSLRLRRLPRRPPSLPTPRRRAPGESHPARAHRERVIVIRVSPAPVATSAPPVPVELIQRERLVDARGDFPFVIARRRRRHAQSRRRRRRRRRRRARESVRVDATVRGPAALDHAMRTGSRASTRRRRSRERRIGECARNHSVRYACQTGSVVASEESTGCDDRSRIRSRSLFRLRNV